MQIKNMFLNVKKFFSFNSFAMALTVLPRTLMRLGAAHSRQHSKCHSLS